MCSILVLAFFFFIIFMATRKCGSAFHGKIWYYIYDGHGSTRLLNNEVGHISDCYAYGNLLKKEDGTENDFLYTGEQYNANPVVYTGLIGYFSLAETTMGQVIDGILEESRLLNVLRGLHFVKKATVVCNIFNIGVQVKSIL